MKKSCLCYADGSLKKWFTLSECGNKIIVEGYQSSLDLRIDGDSVIISTKLDFRSLMGALELSPDTKLSEAFLVS